MGDLLEYIVRRGFEGKEPFSALGEPVAKLCRGRYEAIQRGVEARRRKLEALKGKGGRVERQARDEVWGSLAESS